VSAPITLTWPGHTNGRVPKSELRQLATITLVRRAQPDAAAAFDRMNDALYAETGHRLTMTANQDSYRSLAKQQKLWDAHAANPSGTPSAAWPGTSNHGLGLAIDVTGMTNAVTAKWMRAHADDYGYRINRIKSEPWHIEYVGPITSLAGDGTPITESERDMFWIRRGSGNWWLKVPGEPWREFTQTPADRINKALGSAAKLSEKDCDALRADFPDPTPTTGGGTPVDVQAIAQAVDAALKDDIQKILTAIAGVDEATLATFGLKRA
jgi:hypothetical protein